MLGRTDSWGGGKGGGKMKSRSLCITPVCVTQPQAQVTQPSTQQTFRTPFPLAFPVLLLAPQTGAAPRENRPGDTRSCFGVSLAPGAPLTGRSVPRCDGRRSPSAACRAEQLAYFSCRSSSALPKRRRRKNQGWCFLLQNPQLLLCGYFAARS